MPHFTDSFLAEVSCFGKQHSHLLFLLAGLCSAPSLHQMGSHHCCSPPPFLFWHVNAISLFSPSPGSLASCLAEVSCRHLYQIQHSALLPVCWHSQPLTGSVCQDQSAWCSHSIPPLLPPGIFPHHSSDKCFAQVSPVCCSFKF